MADVPKRLAGPVQLTAASATLYTVPAATTAVIRNIRVCNTTAAAQTFSLAIQGAAGTAANQLFSAYSLPANGVLDMSGFYVLAATEYISGLAGTASTLTIIINGVEST